MNQCCEEMKAKALLVLLTKIGSLPNRSELISRSEAQMELNRILECHNEDMVMALMDDNEKEMFSYLWELWTNNIWTDQVSELEIIQQE
jgi:hypothetical protein